MRDDAGNRLANLGQPTVRLWFLAIAFGDIKNVDYLVEKGADFGKTDYEAGVVQGPREAVEQSAAIDREDFDNGTFGRHFVVDPDFVGPSAGQVGEGSPGGFLFASQDFWELRHVVGIDRSD